MPVTINTDAVDTDAVVATPEVEAETVESNLDSVETNEWDELDTEFNEEDLVEETVLNDEKPADQEEVVEPEVAVEEAEATSDEVTPSEAAATTEAEAETEEVIIAEEETEAPPEVTQEAYNAQVSAAREKATAELVTRFQLTEEQSDDLISDPNSVLPSLLANMYLDLFTNVMQGMRTELPGMVQGVVTSTEKVSKQKNAFFTAWPQLNKSEHMETVRRVGENYSALNPKANQEDFIREVGAQAWVALRLPIEGLLAHTQGAGEVPAAVAPVAPVRSPASPGNASQSGMQPLQRSGNAFEMLADEFLDEDM